MPPRPHWPRAFRRAGRPRPGCGPLSLYPQIDKGPIRCHFGPCRSTLWPIRGSALFGALIPIPFGRFGACRYTLWPIRADLFPFRPLSLYPLAICGHCALYRSTLWPFRRLSLYPLAISALIALPSGRFGPICCHFGPYRSILWSIWLPCRPLPLYPLPISALGYVPFVSVPCWAPCCRTFFKFSSLAMAG